MDIQTKFLSILKDRQYTDAMNGITVCCQLIQHVFSPQIFIIGLLCESVATYFFYVCYFKDFSFKIQGSMYIVYGLVKRRPGLNQYPENMLDSSDYSQNVDVNRWSTIVTDGVAMLWLQILYIVWEKCILGEERTVLSGQCVKWVRKFIFIQEVLTKKVWKLLSLVFLNMVPI